jgi:hypothetical protein
MPVILLLTVKISQHFAGATDLLFLHEEANRLFLLFGCMITGGFG